MVLTPIILAKNLFLRTFSSPPRHHDYVERYVMDPKLIYFSHEESVVPMW